MPVPDFQTAMLPTLELLQDGRERHGAEFVKFFVERFNLTDEEQSQLLPSGGTTVLVSRIAWARTYLKQAGLIESPKRSFFRITKSGLALLNENPSRIDMRLLERYPAYLMFKARSRSGVNDLQTSNTRAVEPVDVESPADALERSHAQLRSQTETELLEQIMRSSPAFFERLVVDVLVAMGYGGSRKDAGRAIGKSGDGGIDGVINEDRLGLDAVYLQAKRWESAVGRPELQKFAGALQGRRATKGVIITTSTFTKDAREYVELIPTRIVLIDGESLVKHMFDFGVGVAPVNTYQVKKLDLDYFEEA